MIVLHILLQILKWIGIILGGLVGLVLLLVLLVLFVPIRYKVKGHKDESIEASVKVSWLLNLFRVKLDYTGGKNLRLRIKLLWFSLADNNLLSKGETEEKGPDSELSDEEFDEKLKAELEDIEPAAAEQSQETSEKAEAAEGVEITDEKNVTENTATVTKQNVTDNTGSTEAAEAVKDAETSAFSESEGFLDEEKTTEESAQEDSASKDEEKKPLDEKIEELFNKIAGIFEKVVRLFEKAGNTKEVITRFLENKHNAAAFELVKKVLVKLLKAIGPKRGKGSLHFGTGDPASTGYALAGLAILYTSLKGRFKITPDFEEKVIEGEGYLSGRIYIITLVVLFCKVWFNKDFKVLKKNAGGLKEQIKNA